MNFSVNSHTCALSDFGMARHLATLVVRKRFTRRQRHATQRRAEAFHGRRGGGVMHPHQHQIACAALNQRAYCRGVAFAFAFAFDQVALPMAGRQPVFGLRRTNMNAEDPGSDHGDLPHPSAGSAWFCPVAGR